MNVTIGNTEFMLKNHESFSHVVCIVDKSFDLVSVIKATKDLIFHNWIISIMDDFEDSPVVVNPAVSIPMLNDVLEIMEFTSMIDEGNVLVSCHGGVCRSTAIGWLILIQHGMTFEAAMNVIQQTSPNAWPNIRIVNFGDRILGLGGRAVNWMHNWRNENESRLNEELMNR